MDDTLRPAEDGLPQTGPKGVLSDYRRFEQVQKQEADHEKQEQLAQMQREAVTCRSALDEEKQTAKSELPSDEAFLRDYKARRMGELKEQASKGPAGQRRYFGNLLEIRGDKFADVIDNAPSNVFVIIHIYDEFLAACRSLNKALTKLAKMYPTAKFCRVQAEHVQVSDAFKKDGLPALLVYRNGEMVGNLLKVSDDLGTEFEVEDVETFLQDKDCLPEAAKQLSSIPRKLTGGVPGEDNDRES